MLDQSHVDHFIEKGFVIIKSAFPREDCLQWVKEACAKEGYSLEKPETWSEERVSLATGRYIAVKDYAPKVWEAACQLLGGEARIAEQPDFCTFIINFRLGADKPYQPPAPQASGWHKDGWFFRHFLDSPEQGLLGIAFCTDTSSCNGGTFIAPDSVGVVAQYLADRPEGILPHEFNHKMLIEQCQEFLEITGEAGDFLLLHPFILHTASQNVLRRPRAIANLLFPLTEPMNFNRCHPDEYSPVEQAILRGLRVKSLDFHPTAPRYSTPDRSQIKAPLTFQERRTVSADPKDVATPDSNPLRFPQPGPQAKPLVWISPTKKWYDLDLVEIWQQRDLVLLLALRDLKIRYRQTLLGALWAIIQSLFPMLVFTLIFSNFMKISTGDIPYPVFVYAGLLPWIYFSGAIANSGNSLLSNGHLVSKIYFPRLILPSAAILPGLVDFAIGTFLLILLMAYYHMSFTWPMMFLPLLMMFIAVLALAVGTIMSALNIVYRDIRHALPLLIQLWMFLTPVIYPSRVVPEQWQWLVSLNPVAGIIENFRALLFGIPVNWAHLGLSVGVTLALLVCAGGLFIRMEKHLADYL